jgi:four helix bundle protein
MGNFNDLEIYQIAFKQAMEIFEMTKNFPANEKFELVSQIRRSSRAVCSNISEGYRKRHYRPYFLNKLSDADMENTETINWIYFCGSCNYITREKQDQLLQKCHSIGRLLNYMLKNPEKFQSKNKF